MPTRITNLKIYQENHAKVTQVLWIIHQGQSELRHSASLKAISSKPPINRLSSHIYAIKYCMAHMLHSTKDYEPTTTTSSHECPKKAITISKRISSKFLCAEALSEDLFLDPIWRFPPKQALSILLISVLCILGIM